MFLKTHKIILNFVDRYHLLKVNQDQVTFLNSPISHKEIEAVINHPPTTTTTKQTNKQTNKKTAQGQIVFEKNPTQVSMKC